MVYFVTNSTAANIMSNNEYEVFISYSRSDSEFALKLGRDLGAEGVNIWLDQLEINTGQIWDVEIEKALETCSKFLIILTPSSVSSKNVHDELSYALANSKQVYPVLRLECRIPYRLSSFQFSDFTIDYDKGFRGLLKALDIARYPIVKIGGQTWMAENLDVSTYQNGDPIPEVQDQGEWENLTKGACCFYENDPANEENYGKLYNWYAVNDPRGLAPKGWHVPSDEEWEKLASNLVNVELSSSSLIETDTQHKESANNMVTNKSVFTSHLGGFRNEHGTFSTIGSFGRWWSATPRNTDAYYRFLESNSTVIQRSQFNMSVGFSIRCVKD